MCLSGAIRACEAHYFYFTLAISFLFPLVSADYQAFLRWTFPGRPALPTRPGNPAFPSFSCSYPVVPLVSLLLSPVPPSTAIYILKEGWASLG